LQGILVAKQNSDTVTQLEALRLIRWSVTIIEEDRELIAVFFDCANMIKAQPRSSFQMPPIKPIPFWPAGNNHPTMVAFLRKDDRPLSELPKPPPKGSQEAATFGFHPALALFEPKPGQLLPEEVYDKRPAIWPSHNVCCRCPFRTLNSRTQASTP
jgi:hypothetical protein